MRLPDRGQQGNEREAGSGNRPQSAFASLISPELPKSLLVTGAMLRPRFYGWSPWVTAGCTCSF